MANRLWPLAGASSNQLVHVHRFWLTRRMLAAVETIKSSGCDATLKDERMTACCMTDRFVDGVHVTSVATSSAAVRTCSGRVRAGARPGRTAP